MRFAWETSSMSLKQTSRFPQSETSKKRAKFFKFRTLRSYEVMFRERASKIPHLTGPFPLYKHPLNLTSSFSKVLKLKTSQVLKLTKFKTLKLKNQRFAWETSSMSLKVQTQVLNSRFQSETSKKRKQSFLKLRNFVVMKLC